jgi:hypothetical protein
MAGAETRPPSRRCRTPPPPAETTLIHHSATPHLLFLLCHRGPTPGLPTLPDRRLSSSDRAFVSADYSDTFWTAADDVTTCPHRGRRSYTPHLPHPPMLLHKPRLLYALRETQASPIPPRHARTPGPTQVHRRPTPNLHEYQVRAIEATATYATTIRETGHRNRPLAPS